MRDRMQGRSKKQGMSQGRSANVFSLPCAMCKTRAKKVGVGRIPRSATMENQIERSSYREGRRTKHARSGAKRGSTLGIENIQGRCASMHVNAETNACRKITSHDWRNVYGGPRSVPFSDV